MRNCQKSFVFTKQGTDYKSAPARVRAWLTGDMAAGSDSHTIDIILVGEDIDTGYLAQLKARAEKMIERAIHTLIITPDEEKQYLSTEKHTLLLWEN